MRGAWWMMVAMATACGGRVTHPDASAAVDAAADVTDDATTCPGGYLAGLPCAASLATCPAGDGCNVCLCARGAWQCTGEACDAGACPATPPSSGDACAMAGSSCDYGAGCVGAHCVCAGGHWTCDPLVCVDI